MDKYYKLQGIILRNRDYREADKLTRLFSLEQGCQTALAKGAGKPKGSLRGVVLPFTQVNLTLARGRGSLDTITQGEIERPFISLRQDLGKIAYASYFCELTDAALPEGKPGAEVFMLLLAAFSLLDLDAPPPLSARFFELRLLAALGMAPRLDSCCSCGRDVPGGQFMLSAPRGGLLCSSCAGPGDGATISAGGVLTMGHLLSSPLNRLPQLKISAATGAELEQALGSYLNYHLERTSKARALLKSLLE